MPQLLPPARRPALKALLLPLFAAVLTLGLAVSSASATVMKYASVERLVEISDIIVHGTVTEQRTYFDSKQKRVVTDTTIQVERSFLGDISESITIQQWGGTYKGTTHHIPGDARFVPGEEVVVFLHTGDGVVALSALSQSKYSVKNIDGKKLVFRNLSDIGMLIEPDDGPKYLKHLPSETRSMKSFVAELEALIAGIKGGDHE